MSTRWTLPILLLVACGGSDPEPVGRATGGPMTAPTSGTETTAEAAPPAEPSEPAEPAQPARPEAQPIAAENADAIREALRVAADDGAALVRMIDPDRGIGAWDRGEAAKIHFCDTARLAREPALGFEIREGDEWSCNSRMTRCSSVDPADRTGTVFHFTEADGGSGRWLDGIIRYERRVPRNDTEDVTAWVRAAEGVCELYGTLTGGPDALSPEKITIFVSRFTEGQEDSSTAFECGDAAKTAARERLAPLMQAGPPTACNREPQACTWAESDEIRVYGRDGAPYAIAVLATNLNEGPTRLQEREVTAVAERAASRRCQ